MMNPFVRFVRTVTTLSILVAPVALLADSGTAHRIDQPFPLKLGTSGGNINDIAKGSCFGGTLGALVQDPLGNQYVLSNNHVLARTNTAADGEAIVQPALIDQIPTCAKDTNDTVANLSDAVPLVFKAKNTIPVNSVDAAIAQVQADKVDPTGYILDIGMLSSSILSPTLDLAVKKSGRTTGLTRGTINAVHVTVDISYGHGKTARFSEQIMITPGTFIGSGDSGSVLVEDVDANPRALGLLFAGSSTVAVANPIEPVLSAFDVTMVGAAESSALLGKIFAWTRNLFRISESHAASAQLPSQVNPAAVEAVKRAKERYESKLLVIPGVIGVGVGRSDRVVGQAAIEIYVEEATESLRRSVPNALDGFGVKIVETGEIRAY